MSLGVYRITQYTHFSAKLFNENVLGEIFEEPITLLDGQQKTIKVKQAWIDNIDVTGVAGWVDDEGIFVECKKDQPDGNDHRCWQVTETDAKAGAYGPLKPFEHVAFNPIYNKTLEKHDKVRIANLGAKTIQDTGRGPENRADREKWLDYYIGIQTMYPTVDVGYRQVWVWRP